MILLTGYTGFLGSRILEKLRNDNLDIILCGRKNSSNDKYIYMDLEHHIPSEEAFEGIKTVIHFAAILPDKLEHDYSEILKNELLFIENCYNSGVENFIFASSGAVYGANGRYIESDKLSLTSSYGEYKQVIENQICRLWLNTHLIFRYFFPYGKGQKLPRLFPSVIDKIKNGNEIYLKGDKGIMFNPIYVDDAIFITEKLIEKQCKGIYNIAGFEEVYLEDIILYISDILNINSNIKKISLQEKQLLIGSNTKSISMIGEFDFVNIRTAIDKMLDKYQ